MLKNGLTCTCSTQTGVVWWDKQTFNGVNPFQKKKLLNLQVTTFPIINNEVEWKMMSKVIENRQAQFYDVNHRLMAIRKTVHEVE